MRDRIFVDTNILVYATMPTRAKSTLPPPGR